MDTSVSCILPVPPPQDKELLVEGQVSSFNREDDDSKTQLSPYATGVDSTDNALINSEFSESMEEYTGVGCCHPATKTHRYFVLIFMCLLAFGEYFAQNTLVSDCSSSP